jgi:DNA-binding SARP family transcriptional activator/basic membrane lipoprotein Med (substrate-binding protein (PBP1-ABC) superfamily)
VKVFLAGRIAVEAEGIVLDERHFSGRQGRLLFAYLVARQGRPVPRDELADVLWGDAPPATWEKALSVLVSKLRGVLSESGLDGASALTAAFGCYQLDLPEGTTVDVLEAENATEEAESLLSTEEWERATGSATSAESILREPFLPGEEGTWVEAKRRELAEVRVRALSVLAEACLSSGSPEQAARWAEHAIEAEPFRESGYRLLMEAQAAAGNRAEALQTYDRCRRLLAEELGAYPSPETESIYRSLLDTSGMAGAHATAPTGTGPRRASRRTRPSLAIAALVILIATAAAIAVFATRSNGSRRPSAARMTRVALVLPRTSLVSDDPTNQYSAALARARSTYPVQTQTFQINLSKPGLSTKVRKSLDSFDLVLLAGQRVSARFVHEMARHPHTRFMVIDPDPSQKAAGLYAAVTTLPNATDVFYVEGSAALLAGYLSALWARHEDPGKHPIVVSMVASDREENLNQINGFTSGADYGGAAVRTGYSHDSPDPAVCAKIANRQFDRGSTVVFADAGACSVGALAVAGERHRWAIGADQDMSNFGQQVLASTVKRLGWAVDYAVRHYLAHTLPQGHIDVGIAREVVDINVSNSAIPASILKKLDRVRHENIKDWSAMEMSLQCTKEGRNCGGGRAPKPPDPLALG